MGSLAKRLLGSQELNATAQGLEITAFILNFHSE